MIVNMHEYQYHSFVRRENNIPIKDVATFIGCDATLISKYERGRIEMGDDKVRKYRQFLSKYENIF
jgi:transcriptional regulator with XRE-family HTH domain